MPNVFSILNCLQMKVDSFFNGRVWKYLVLRKLADPVSR
jgi:hypothetical protein